MLTRLVGIVLTLGATTAAYTTSDSIVISDADYIDDVHNSLEKVPADPDVGKDMVEIVQTRGYEIETHYVTTADNYILTMFRIPSSVENAPAVILQHGLLDSSFTWVSNFEDESLGYILSDAGYDVWFGNNRGNVYGRNHTSLDPDAKTDGFWDFTWDEMAAEDVPAMINYVCDTTHRASLSWVGHSEGTIQMFAAGSSLEDNTNDYFQRALKSVNLFVALAPVAYVKNMKSKPIIKLAQTDLPQKLYQRGVTEFLPDGRVDSIAPEICQLVDKGCDLFLMVICGPSFYTNTSRIQVYVSRTPAGTSTLNMQHWQQGVLYPTFQKFDWGSVELNQAHYGVDVPPMYNLTKHAVPTALFYGDNDYLADPTDVQTLISELPAETIVFQDHNTKYAHLDYTWAYNANTEIYGKIVDLMGQYNKQ